MTPLPSAILAAVLIAPMLAHAGKGHVHGAGAMNVGIENGRIGITLELPLDALTGFERAPRNTAEKSALEQAGRALNDAAALFVPTPAANCRLAATQVALPFLDGKPAPADDHADVTASYVFECADASALKGIETTLFRHFKRLYRIEVQRVGPRGQGASRLTPKQPVVAW